MVEKVELVGGPHDGYPAFVRSTANIVMGVAIDEPEATLVPRGVNPNDHPAPAYVRREGTSIFDYVGVKTRRQVIADLGAGDLEEWQR